jgi:hypothetical protein
MTNEAHTTARQANELNSRLGSDLSLSDFSDPEYLDEDERWEREGRREMYHALFGEGWGY